jgi:hypothetical protein
MTDDFHSIYLDVNAGSAQSPSPAYPSTAGEPPENRIGDREPVVEASSHGGAGEGVSEFRELSELFSGHRPTLDIELTILTNNQGYATKVFGLDQSGQLAKRSAANIYEGQAERIAIANLAELRDLIGSLQPTQALCFGVPQMKLARLLTTGDASFRFFGGRRCARPGPLFLSASSTGHPDARLRSPSRPAASRLAGN